MSSPEALIKYADAIEYAGNNLKITITERIYVFEALKHKWFHKMMEDDKKRGSNK